MLRHPLTHVGAGRYRTRTARPRRRRGNKHPSGVFVSARFLTRRNVYQERCRPTHSSRVFLFWWTVQDENRDKQRQGITIMGVSCLLIFLTRRGILGSVQQIGIWRGDLHEKEHIKNRRFGNADYSCCIYNVCGEPSRNEFSLEQYHYLVTVWFVCSCDSRATYCT